ncbi:MAG TPA: hypothetical protein VLC97_01365 [Rhodanobacteraceae bacterium]|nr:hypothetical protein [Rhodanobacteraceae bacterium]
MIATDRFVYVHLHKSGGSFVNECLLRFFADARQLGYHLPLSLLPAPLRALPVLGFVRSPWSYYVSWYAFQSQRPRPNALFRCVSDDGALNFRASVRNLVGLGDDHARLDRLLGLLPDRYGDAGFGLNLPNFALAPIRSSGMGFYSFLYQYMYTSPGIEPAIGRCESLRAEFLAFLERVAAPVSAELREFVETAAPRNTSAHGDWREYYDRELADFVAERDATVIERFGYEFAR